MKLARLDRLKKWEPPSHKNERAYFCAPGLPIVPEALPWDPRVAGFPAILASNPGHPVNPVQNSCPLGLPAIASLLSQARRAGLWLRTFRVFPVGSSDPERTAWEDRS